MGYKNPRRRDGTGPAKRSFQRKTAGDVGRRRQSGQKCPKKK